MTAIRTAAVAIVAASVASVAFAADGVMNGTVTLATSCHASNCSCASSSTLAWNNRSSFCTSGIEFECRREIALCVETTEFEGTTCASDMMIGAPGAAVCNECISLGAESSAMVGCTEGSTDTVNKLFNNGDCSGDALLSATASSACASRQGQSTKVSKAGFKCNFYRNVFHENSDCNAKRGLNVAIPQNMCFGEKATSQSKVSCTGNDDLSGTYVGRGGETTISAITSTSDDSSPTTTSAISDSDSASSASAVAAFAAAVAAVLCVVA